MLDVLSGDSDATRGHHREFLPAIAFYHGTLAAHTLLPLNLGAGFLECQQACFLRPSRLAGKAKLAFSSPTLTCPTLFLTARILNACQSAIKKIIPLADRVLVQRVAAQAKVKGREGLA